MEEHGYFYFSIHKQLKFKVKKESSTPWKNYENLSLLYPTTRKSNKRKIPKYQCKATSS